MDLSEPEMVQDSFVDAELRSHRADLLYRVRLRDGSDAYAYVLFEHKSIPDWWVAFQLLRYIVRIWERNLRERGKLWPIVPLVVYHGRDRWWVEPTFGELIGAPESLAAYMPDYRYLLCDLTTYTDEELKGEALLRVALMALKHVFRPELRERLPDLMGILRELARRETGLEYIETVLRYLAQAAVYVGAEELGEARRSAGGVAGWDQIGPQAALWQRGTAVAARDLQDRGRGRAAGHPRGARDGEHPRRTGVSLPVRRRRPECSVRSLAHGAGRYRSCV